MTGAPTIVAFPAAPRFGRRSSLRKQLLGALRASGCCPVILDMTECRTLDGQDVEMLIDCVAQSAGQDTPLFLAAGSPAMRVILDVTQISAVVPVFDSLQEALSVPPAGGGTYEPQIQQRSA